MDSVLILKLKISTCTTRREFVRHGQRISIASTVCNSDPIMGKQLQTLNPHLISHMCSTLHTLYSIQEVSFVLFHFDFNATILNLLQKNLFFFTETHEGAVHQTNGLRNYLGASENKELLWLSSKTLRMGTIYHGRLWLQEKDNGKC